MLQMPTGDAVAKVFKLVPVDSSLSGWPEVGCLETKSKRRIDTAATRKMLHKKIPPKPLPLSSHQTTFYSHTISQIQYFFQTANGKI